mmetsp:Transcript_16492/g.46051  ORF Transcript_16492/g.46051 Transcript_16492/m.46051 type:complete len:180 (+) Transcript_16492:313-852(+)|eukprot:CAMPEP_0119549850 /NCGR_PEP_ID=MMETSP1352-20130426/3476_1 /TAXON_ID=265584 /ORGANISM="Stauroneis constricta, Strain CCMP1120" /LENGTH=179 /DNA_ID=CAMNT_0007595527 /DNA_START=288 /DNA_END=827 /DNA_ORIENTATION=+
MTPEAHPPKELLNAVKTEAGQQKDSLKHQEPESKQALLSSVRTESHDVKGQLQAVSTGSKRDLLSEVRREGSQKKLAHVEPVAKQELMSEVRRTTDTDLAKKHSVIAKKQDLVQNLSEQAVEAAKDGLKHVKPVQKNEVLQGVRVEGKTVKKELKKVETAGKQILMSDVRMHANNMDIL